MSKIYKHFASNQARIYSLNVVLIIGSALINAACSFMPADSDGPPLENNIKLDDIEDAVPRNEPRSKSGNPASYVVFGKRYYVQDSSQGYVKRGVASWYGKKFHGRRTSSGETYDMYKMTAAHRTLPLPSYVEVTNLENQNRIIVRVNDRGPFHDDRIIDLSYAAAHKLDILDTGTAAVEVRAIGSDQPALNSNETNLPGTQISQVGTAKKNQAPPPSEPAVLTAPDLKQTISTQTDAKQPVFVQVGAFSNKRNAEQLVTQLKTQFTQPITITEAQDGKLLFHVRVGPIHSSHELAQIESLLSAGGIDQTIIVVSQ